MIPAEQRFWAKVAKGGPDDCWEWRGKKANKGYGRFYVGPQRGQDTQAHRWAYEQLVGPIPEGLQIDHLCGNTACCNPGHMEPVTCRENLLRGNGVGGRNARKTHCVNGHPFDEVNTILSRTRRGGWHRQCRVCLRERQRRYRCQEKGEQAATS